MHVAFFIVIALALGLCDMLLFRRCAEATPIRLSSGLLAALAVAVIHVFMYWLGAFIGNLIQLESIDNPMLFARENAYICLGLFLIVVIKMLFPYLRREPRLPLFSLGSASSVLAMAFASGINVLLLGIGTGFVEQGIRIHCIVWPLFIATFIFGYLGVMYGRQKVQMRPRRWMVAACILLLGVGIAAVVNA